MVGYIGLAGITSIYLVQAAVMDVKEKKIYSFPCLILTFLWGIYLAYTGARDLQFLGTFWMIHAMIFIFLNKGNIWGAGDSDILLLFANVYLSITAGMSGYGIAFYECLVLIACLGLSLFVGVIEHRLRHQEIKITGNVAVVPGFSLIMIIMMLAEIVGGV